MSTPPTIHGRAKLAAVATAVVLASGVAGWGGSMMALAADDTTLNASPDGSAQTSASSGLTTSAATTSAGPTGPTTTQPSASLPTVAPPHASIPPTGAPTDASATATRRTGAATPDPDAPSRAAGPDAPARLLGRPDIVFVSPYSDGEESRTGRWYYQVGLVGAPADTVVELSGPDDHGNLRAAALALTTADGSVNPFAVSFQTHFAYGGTCDAARPASVTARGAGFSVTETVPRPLECDGGTTPAGPWSRPSVPAPPTTSAPSGP